MLPARVKDYASSWLDDLCTVRPHDVDAAAPAGQRRAGRRALVAAHARPSCCCRAARRRPGRAWPRPPADDEPLGGRAQRVFDFLEANGASFFDEIADGARLLRAELEDALAELVVRGRANCDSYAGLRALLVPAAKRATAASRSRRRVALFGIEDAGRWNVDARGAGRRRRDRGRRQAAEAIEHVARTLLRRYGVVCFQLLEREAAWLPPWRELVRVYRRLEARGEIRGGRFIAGVTGEQFALPDAIATMRAVRRQPPDDDAGVPVGVRPGQPAGHRARRPQGAARRRLARAVPRRPGDRHQRRRPDRAAGAAGPRAGARGDARAGARSAGAVHGGAGEFGDVQVPPS